MFGSLQRTSITGATKKLRQVASIGREDGTHLLNRLNNRTQLAIASSTVSEIEPWALPIVDHHSGVQKPVILR